MSDRRSPLVSDPGPTSGTRQEFAGLLYGARRVVLDVAAFNERAIRLYRRLGFDKTGRHVETFDGYGAVEFIDMEKLDGEKPG